MGWMVNTLHHPRKIYKVHLKCKLKLSSITIIRQKTFKTLFIN